MKGGEVHHRCKICRILDFARIQDFGFGLERDWDLDNGIGSDGYRKDKSNMKNFGFS